MNVVSFQSPRHAPRDGQVSVWEYVCALQDAVNECDISWEEGELFVCHALLDALEEEAAKSNRGVSLAAAA